MANTTGSPACETAPRRPVYGLAGHWRRAGAGLSSAAANPVVPGTMAGYSGTPLPEKLGIKPGSTVALLGAPDDFVETLGALPTGFRSVTKSEKTPP